MCVFFFKQETAYEMRISDWSSDVCSSDLGAIICLTARETTIVTTIRIYRCRKIRAKFPPRPSRNFTRWSLGKCSTAMRLRAGSGNITARPRSEEHTSELQSLMRPSYAVFCLKKKPHRTTSYLTLSADKQHTL